MQEQYFVNLDRTNQEIIKMITIRYCQTTEEEQSMLFELRNKIKKLKADLTSIETEVGMIDADNKN